MGNFPSHINSIHNFNQNLNYPPGEQCFGFNGDFQSVKVKIADLPPEEADPRLAC
jgi:hypothetical protein